MRGKEKRRRKLKADWAPFVKVLAKNSDINKNEWVKFSGEKNAIKVPKSIQWSRFRRHSQPGKGTSA